MSSNDQSCAVVAEDGHIYHGEDRLVTSQWPLEPLVVSGEKLLFQVDGSEEGEYLLVVVDEEDGDRVCHLNTRVYVGPALTEMVEVGVRSARVERGELWVVTTRAVLSVPRKGTFGDPTPRWGVRPLVRLSNEGMQFVSSVKVVTETT